MYRKYLTYRHLEMFLNEFLLRMTEIDLVFDILLMLVIAKNVNLMQEF